MMKEAVMVFLHNRLTVANPTKPWAPNTVATMPLKLDRPPPPRRISVNRSDFTSLRPILIGRLSPTNVTDVADLLLADRTDVSLVDDDDDDEEDEDEAYAQSTWKVNARSFTNELRLD